MSNPQTFLNIVNAQAGVVAPGGAPNISTGQNSAPLGYATCGIGGPTTSRPKVGDPGVGALTIGTHFLDTTISAVVCWDGVNWRNPFSGALA